MTESFGVRLQQRRKAQNVALSTIADETKIKLSLLEGLERDDLSHWPCGIFRRAYVRAYAHAIGLSPDDVLREFLDVHPDPDQEAAISSAMHTAAEGTATMGAPPSRLRSMVNSAFESLARRRQVLVGGTRLAPLDTMDESAAEPAHRNEVAPAIRELRVPEGPISIPEAVPTIGSTPGVAPVLGAREDHPQPGNPPFETPDLGAFARLCTELGRVETAGAILPLLREAAQILNATGMIVWMWDSTREELRPALAHGYSRRVLADLPAVGRDADNATAEAFRFVESSVIEGDANNAGALVVPLQTPAGCSGVLAFELRNGAEHNPSIRALATVLGALLAQLVGNEATAEREGELDTPSAGGLRLFA